MDLKAKLQLLQGQADDLEPSVGVFGRIPRSLRKAIGQAKKEKLIKSMDWAINYGLTLLLLNLEEKRREKEAQKSLKKGA